MQKSFNRIDEKWPTKGQNPVPGMLTKKMKFLMNAKKELILMKRLLSQVRVAYSERGPRCSRSARGRRCLQHRCRLNLSCLQHGGRAPRPSRPPRVRCRRGRPCPRTKRGRVPRVQWIQHQQQHVQQLLQQHWRRSHEGFLTTSSIVFTSIDSLISTFYSINSNLICNHSFIDSQNEYEYDVHATANEMICQGFQYKPLFRFELRIKKNSDKITFGYTSIRVLYTSIREFYLPRESHKKFQKSFNDVITLLKDPQEGIAEDETCSSLGTEKRENTASPNTGITAPSAWGEDQNHSKRDKILRCVYTDYISLYFPTFPTGSRPFSGLRPPLPTP